MGSAPRGSSQEPGPDRFEAAARFGPTGVDLSLAATLRFPNGILAQVDCGFEQPFRCTYELVGTTGVIEVPDAYLPPTGRPPSFARREGVKEARL